VRKTLTAFITQRTEFRSGTTNMRPGQLVTISQDGVNYALLFLHLASGNDPRGMGLRDDMLERALEFRKALDKSAGGAGKANYIFLGDLNTMGMKYPFDRNIVSAFELQKLDAFAVKVSMKRLAKTHDNSWSNGSKSSLKPSNLDHVFASDNLTFRSFTRSDGTKAQVDVRGWASELSIPAQDAWIKEYSDHSMLYFEVMS
jgi:endonuclease/exonuclease/phosphatase family metal-dependent hydrolase